MNNKKEIEILLISFESIRTNFFNIYKDDRYANRESFLSIEGIKIYNSYAKKFNELDLGLNLHIFPENYDNKNKPKTFEVLSQINIAISIITRVPK